MDACRIGVDNWFRRCFHNCRLQDCRDGSQFGEKQPVRIIVSAGRWDTPHIDFSTRAKLLDMLCASGVESPQWWWDVLVGEGDPLYHELEPLS